MRKLEIDRRRWLQGRLAWPHGINGSLLYRNTDKRMCCLGFMARACGAKVSQIRGRGSPENVPSIDWPDGMIGDGRTNIEAVREVMKLNDDPSITSKQRETRVKRALKAFGFNVVFTGEYAE